MQFRQKIFPRAPADIGCFLLIFTCIPITFIFEMTVVLPEFHDSGGFLYIFTWIAGLFLLFNITSNIMSCMLLDTSVKTVLLQPPTDPAKRKLWHLCSACEILVPPRSWHCQICRTCILKRDHHCVFTGCCIGHKNHRYFIYFIIYMAIGAAYSTTYNSLYFWYLHADTYLNLATCLKMVFPLFFVGLDVSWRNLFLFIYEINVIAFAYSSVLIAYHAPTILRGAVAYERGTNKYNLGSWQRNLKMILGERWHLTWISPFIQSKLQHDGVNWDAVLQQSEKNR